MTTTRQLHFRDRRPPHEIQFALERALMTLLRPSLEETQLTFTAAAKRNGVPYRVLLRLEAALLLTNCYSLQFEADEKDLSPNGKDKYLDAWVDLWCKNWERSTAPKPGEGSTESGQRLAEQTLAAESHLTDVPSIQQEILGALRRGASYSTAHKEGGTNISYRRDRFVAVDFGESDQVQSFPDEATFLAFLRRFYDWETSSSTYPEKASDYEAWKLTLRLLNQKR